MRLISLSRRASEISLSLIPITSTNAFLRSFLDTLPSKSQSNDLKTSRGVNSRSLYIIRLLLYHSLIYSITSYYQSNVSDTKAIEGSFYSYFESPIDFSLWLIISMGGASYFMKPWNYSKLIIPIFRWSIILNICSRVGWLIVIIERIPDENSYRLSKPSLSESNLLNIIR